MKRQSTGSITLDAHLEGGFPKGNMIMITGNSGTGKTTICTQFLLNENVKNNDKGLYVSFSEGRTQYISNMNRVGFNIEEASDKGCIKILDFLPAKTPGVDTAIQMITETVMEEEIERLVIDNYSALTQAMPSTIESRITLQLLSRILSSIGCTTIIVIEKPYGYETLGTGCEEFVVDGIIELGYQKTGCTKKRQLKILKMKKTRVSHHSFSFIINEGVIINEDPDEVS